jgi:hypothetical protein
MLNDKQLVIVSRLTEPIILLQKTVFRIFELIKIKINLRPIVYFELSQESLLHNKHDKKGQPVLDYQHGIGYQSVLDYQPGIGDQSVLKKSIYLKAKLISIYPVQKSS